MRDFFFRTPAVGDDEPVDLAQVRADDAMIEALRQVPLFDEPAAPPASWLRPYGAAPGASVDDIAFPDTAFADTAIADTALSDTGSADTAFSDTASADAASADTASADAAFAAFARAVSDDGSTGDTGTIGDPKADAQIAALLQAWRHELDAVPLPPPLDLQVATAIVRAAPARRRSVRPMIAVAAAIAGLLMGSTAIGARSATPDNALLWPVTQLLWGDRVDEVNASIEARQGIDIAAKAIDAGHPEQAEAALDHVTVVITKVEDSSERRTLESDLGRVQSQLESSRATSAAPTAASTTPVPGIAGTTTLNPATPTVPSVTSSSSSSEPSVSSDAPSTDPVLPATTPDPTTSDAEPSDPSSDATPTGSTGSTDPATTADATTGTGTTATGSTEAGTTATDTPDQVPPVGVPPADVPPADVPPAGNVVPDQGSADGVSAN